MLTDTKNNSKEEESNTYSDSYSSSDEENKENRGIEPNDVKEIKASSFEVHANHINNFQQHIIQQAT